VGSMAVVFGRLAWIVAACFAALALLQTMRLAWLRGAARRRLEHARRRGREGERAALALMERNGYCIDALQPELQWTIVCDGEPHSVALRADMLVSRAGRTFVAEVKTGEGAPRLQTPGTRRQLLEYSVAYAVDGVLLVDVESARIHEVRFPRVAARGGSSGGLVWVAAALIGVVVWALWSRGQLP
jgi:hypothetical protein